MPSITLTKIIKEEDGQIRVRFGKVEREYASLADMRASVRAALDQSDLIDLALALILSRQPALGNPSALDGRTITIDFSKANWGSVS